MARNATSFENQGCRIIGLSVTGKPSPRFQIRQIHSVRQIHSDSSEKFIPYVMIGKMWKCWSAHRIAYFKTCFDKNDEKLPIGSWWRQIADRFVKLCENPRHTVGVMYVRLYSLGDLMKRLRVRPVTQPLNVTHLRFITNKEEEGGSNDSFLEFLEFIKPGATLKFTTGGLTKQEMNTLCEMEHWKRSRGLDLVWDNFKYRWDHSKYEWDIPSMDNFYHFNSLRLNFQKMSAKDAKGLIQAFIHKPAKSYKNHSTYFRISTKEFVDPAAILNSNDDELKKLIVLESENDYDQIRVQSFPMANSDFVLLVKAAGMFFAGSVCRENALKEDFENPPDL